MYLDIKKLGERIGMLLSVVLIVFGFIGYIFMATSQEQTTSILLAIFGLLLFWMIKWQARG